MFYQIYKERTAKKLKKGHNSVNCSHIFLDLNSKHFIHGFYHSSKNESDPSKITQVIALTDMQIHRQEENITLHNIIVIEIIALPPERRSEGIKEIIDVQVPFLLN